MIKVFMVDDSVECCYSVHQCMAIESDLEMVGTAGDGNEAVQKISKLKPDVVLLDITLPGLDGIGVLKKIVEEVPGVIVIMLTALGSSHIMNEALKYGAQYYIMKPFSIPELFERIRGIYSSRARHVERNLQSPMETYISKALKCMGVMPNLKGYRYLEQAIEIMVECRECSVTKEIYPRIAKRMNTTPMCVERGIRHAIEMLWEKGDKSQLERYFGSECFANGRPTNAQFIATMADELSLEYVVNI